MIAVPAALPNWADAVRMDPTVAAMWGGVTANSAMLKRIQYFWLRTGTGRRRRYILCRTVHNGRSSSTEAKSRESEWPVVLLGAPEDKQDGAGED